MEEQLIFSNGTASFVSQGSAVAVQVERKRDDSQSSSLDVFAAMDGMKEKCIGSQTGENCLFTVDVPSGMTVTLKSSWEVIEAKMYVIPDTGGGSGGGEGTSDYNRLENKPKINSMTLIGNKSFSDLGIQVKESVLYIP